MGVINYDVQVGEMKEAPLPCKILLIVYHMSIKL